LRTASRLSMATHMSQEDLRGQDDDIDGCGKEAGIRSRRGAEWTGILVVEDSHDTWRFFG
jgi:hypothetical protein